MPITNSRHLQYGVQVEPNKSRSCSCTGSLRGYWRAGNFKMLVFPGLGREPYPKIDLTCNMSRWLNTLLPKYAFMNICWPQHMKSSAWQALAIGLNSSAAPQNKFATWVGPALCRFYHQDTSGVCSCIKTSVWNPTTTWDRPMMTDAPDMKPAMTEWEMKLVIQPSLKTPTSVYITPARKATYSFKTV